jgi:lysozyme
MNRELLMKELVHDEGCRLHMYKDSLGVETIGIGHNLRDVPISERAAGVIFEDDLRNVEDALDRELPWWRSLSEERQRVVANMAFNLGVLGLLEFKRTLRAMEIGDYKAAAVGMLSSRWASQVGDRAVRLAKLMDPDMEVWHG